MSDRESLRRPFGLHRAPVHDLPTLHQLVLPTPWEVGPVQIYLDARDPVTLVDTGVKNPDSWAALEAALDALGLGPDDVQRVVLTHHHGDHLGQAQSLRDAGARLEVWAHAVEAPTIEAWSAERDEAIDATNDLFREYGVPEDVIDRQTAMRRRWLVEDPPLCEPTRVDRRLREGDRIAFKDYELEVIHAPGHTAGHLLLSEPQTGTLITGDHLMGDAVPFTDTYFTDDTPDAGDPLQRRPRFRGLPEYFASLRRLRGRTFRTLLPAHGGVIERPTGAIDEALLFYEVRVQRIARTLEKLAGPRGEVTAWEVWRALFPKADPIKQMRTRMLMVIGGLDVLEDDGRARVGRRADGAVVHTPRS